MNPHLGDRSVRPVSQGLFCRVFSLTHSLTQQIVMEHLLVSLIVLGPADASENKTARITDVVNVISTILLVNQKLQI